MIGSRAVLRLVTTERPGLVRDVSNLLYELGANILSAGQHVDPEANKFFQRIELVLPVEGEEQRARLHRVIGEACEGWGMQWSMRYPEHQHRRMALLTSKHAHCTMDLLARHRSGELPCEIPLVVSNHPDLSEEVTRRGYHYVHEPIVDRDKADQEARIQRRLEEADVELVVLARYMQILSSDFASAWEGRLINIHHSFLPAFIGAEPYRQAYQRGVKIIGATSHYVTAELDQGPIIAQDIVRVSHRDTVSDLVRKGRDVERTVLAHAVRCHLEDRIISYGNKTVVFD